MNSSQKKKSRAKKKKKTGGDCSPEKEDKDLPARRKEGATPSKARKCRKSHM